MAYAIPTAYVALIAAVAIHELLGHGVTAWIVGGSFDGFALMPDGMGWAAAYSEEHENIVLAGGVVAGLLVGAALFYIALRQAHVLLRATILLFAICSLLDATPYAFWNSVFPRPPGDFGRILIEQQSEILRWSLIFGFGLVYLASTIAGNIAMFRCMEITYGALTVPQMLIVAGIGFGAGGSLLWFTFDWNQVIADIGRLPQYVGAGLQLLIAPVLVTMRRGSVPNAIVSRRAWAVAITTAWLTVGALLFVILVWLQHGVYWEPSPS